MGMRLWRSLGAGPILKSILGTDEGGGIHLRDCEYCE